MRRADSRPRFAIIAAELHQKSPRGLAELFHPSARHQRLTRAHGREEIRLGMPDRSSQTVILEPSVPAQFRLPDKILDHAMGQRDGPRIEHNPSGICVFEADGHICFEGGHSLRFYLFAAHPARRNCRLELLPASRNLG